MYNQINHVWIHKKILIPAELVGDSGNKKIEYYKIIEASSLMEWYFQFLEISESTLKVKKA